MLHVNNNHISLTRGDTAKFTVSVRDSVSDSDYTIEEGDRLIFSVKKSLLDRSYQFQKSVESSNVIQIDPVDTSKMEYGDYIYDVQLNKVNGEVYTVIEPSTFTILPEVTT